MIAAHKERVRETFVQWNGAAILMIDPRGVKAFVRFLHIALARQGMTRSIHTEASLFGIIW